MDKRGKVIKALEEAEVVNGVIKMSNQFRDMVVEQLKEKDPVEPEWEGGGSHYWHVCGECHGVINSVDSYCRHCGRRIQWDGH